MSCSFELLAMKSTDILKRFLFVKLIVDAIFFVKSIFSPTFLGRSCKGCPNKFARYERNV